MASSAKADVTLLSLDNPAAQTGVLYDFDFSATTATTTISFAGYQHPAVEFVYAISVTEKNGGANLLGNTWSYEPAASGGGAKVLASGAALEFYGVFNNEYDTFSQDFKSTPGDDYVLKFSFTSISGLMSTVATSLAAPAPNTGALLVTTSGLGLPPVPEPSTWAMMLIGLAGLGLVGHRRRAKLDRGYP